MEEKKGFFTRLFQGLNKTRENLSRGLSGVFSASNIDDDFYEELEEVLIMADIGVRTTDDILTKLKEDVKSNHIKEPAECRSLLIDSITETMNVGEAEYDFEKQKSVILVVGVNGVGKTTSIGKLALMLKDAGLRVMMAAADTFRAAAVEQLNEWSKRAGVDIIKGIEGQDPGSVVFDACSSAKARGVDVLICDTAGRLHNKKNLMEELKKLNRIIERELPDYHKETLVVLDAATGQNALNQAREFKEATDVSGVILTKMDGTSKGGIAIAVQSELGIPVKYIGVGESVEDLQKFNSKDYVDAIFAE